MSKTDYNQHLANAWSLVTAYKEVDHTPESSFCIVNGQDITFSIQSGPVKEEGRNGCDATDLIRYTIGLYKSFNSAHPCRENSITITKLEEALHWQEARTRDRVERNVEGTSNV